VHWSRSAESGRCRGSLGDEEDLTSSVRRQLAEKVDLRDLLTWTLAVFSDPHRIPAFA